MADNTPTKAAPKAPVSAVNAEQDAEIAGLKAQLDTLMKLVTVVAATKSGPPLSFPAQGAEAIKLIKAARTKERKTYRALEEGTDYEQGIVKAGELFTTNQPQGEWMELVEQFDDEVSEDA
jgi:hypothetical protein